MKTVKIKTGWHKATDSFACTCAQLKYLRDLCDAENCENWCFNSTTNALRSLSRASASEAIDALKRGDRIEFV